MMFKSSDTTILRFSSMHGDVLSNATESMVTPC